MTANVNPQSLEDGSFPDELKPGTRLLHGQYVIESFLNSGGFGITYLAKDSLDRQVVIKECFPGSFCRRSDTIVCVRSRAHQGEFTSIVKLFVQEAKNLAKLKHPNIVGVHQIFEDNDTAYMALDFVEGRDLLDIIEDPNDAMTPADIQSMTRKLLSAVDYIHKAGVLHRDISPDNILVNRRDSNPVLIDFGAAREEATKQTRMLSAMRVVKDGYSPQEFYIQGSQQTPSSDLYALGATIYHLITGECPPDSQQRLAAVAAQKPDPFRAFPPEMQGYTGPFLEAINKAMNIFPYDRIQSADEWLKMVTPGPELLALPTSNIRPTRPTAVIAEDLDLADHAEARKMAAPAEPPVPAHRPAMPAAQPRDPGEANLSSLRETKSKSSGKVAVLLGTVAACVALGAAAAIFLMPQATNPPAPPPDQAAAALEIAAEPSVLVSEIAGVQTAEPAPDALAVEAEDVAVASEPADRSLVLTLDTPGIENPVPPVAEQPQTLPVISHGAPAPETEAEAPAVIVLSNQPQPVIEMVEPAVAEVVAAVPETIMSPPAAPLTTAPALGDQLTVADGVPQVFGVIEPDEASPERFLSFLPDQARADVPPSVDLVTPEPQPAKVAQQEPPEIMEAAPVMAGWTIDLPFTEDASAPGTIRTIKPGAGTWVRPGQRIVAVNGVAVASFGEISDAVRATTDVTGATVDVAVSYLDPGADTVVTQTMEFPAARDVALLNGVQFRTMFINGEWHTIVSASPATDPNHLRAGDRLIAYIPTSEKFDREDTISQIFERELDAGTSRFAFAVNRGGELWVASLGYSAPGDN